MRKERKHYTAEEKVSILRRHLLDKVKVSDLCEQNGVRPTVFYRWQKEFFENGAAAFQAKERPVRQVEWQGTGSAVEVTFRRNGKTVVTVPGTLRRMAIKTHETPS